MMRDDQFRRLLDDFGYSWEGYRKVRKGVVKRLVRHMGEIGVRDAEDYMELVKRDLEVRQKTRLLMTVSVSRFFRDHPLWIYLKEFLLPELAAENKDGVAVWSAGCALGQEVYSFTMLWRYLEEESGPLPPLHLYATDINREYLRRAEAGLYDTRAAGEIPACLGERYLRQEGESYLVTEAARRGITWRVHDLAGPPPAEDFFHLVFLRNSLLTYYRKERQGGMLRGIAKALKPWGFLVIGWHEVPPAGDLECLEIKECPGVLRVPRGGLKTPFL